MRWRHDQPVKVTLTALAAVLLIAGCASGARGGGGGGAEAGWTSGNPKIDRLAAKGHASAIQLVRTEQIADNCGSSAPNWYAVSTTNDTGRKLAADMLAFVSDNWTPDSGCSAFLYVFHNEAETHQAGYTVGAVKASAGELDVTVGGPDDAPIIEINYGR